MIKVHLQNEHSNIKTQKGSVASLQYRAGLFILEGIVRGGDAHQERVVSGVFTAVVHEVSRGFGHLETDGDMDEDSLVIDYMYIHAEGLIVLHQPDIIQ